MSRLLLKLNAVKNFEYDLKYFNKLQGFIYNALRDTSYKRLHDKKGYKYFCFSNIFPTINVKSGDSRCLLVSSPDAAFIHFFSEKLNKIKEADETVKIGEAEFKINEIVIFYPKINKKCSIITATPIIIRIPKHNYEKYGIKIEKKKYVYWRPEYAFEVFVKQLEENLFKKYNEFYKTKVEEFPLFEQFQFKKSTCNHVIINGKEHKVIGSIWEFTFSHLSPKQRKILEFGLDCGFGERNSLGFGFVNVVKNGNTK